MKRSTIVAAAVLGIGTVGLGTPAWAFFSSVGTSSGATGYAKAHALGTPRVLGVRALDVGTFTIVPPSSGLQPEGYRVTNEANGNVVCEVRGTINICVGVAPGLGNVTYLVSAFRGPWTSLSPARCQFVALVTISTCGSSAAAAPAAASKAPVSTKEPEAPVAPSKPEPASTADPAPVAEPTVTPTAEPAGTPAAEPAVTPTAEPTVQEAATPVP